MNTIIILIIVILIFQLIIQYKCIWQNIYIYIYIYILFFFYNAAYFIQYKFIYYDLNHCDAQINPQRMINWIHIK